MMPSNNKLMIAQMV